MTEKREGERTPREATAEQERQRRERAHRSGSDPREEEGYDQPQSSAQKQPPEP